MTGPNGTKGPGWCFSRSVSWVYSTMPVTNHVTLVVALTVVFYTGSIIADTKALVRTHDDAEYRGSVTVAIDGQKVLSFQYREADKQVDAGKIEFPVGKEDPLYRQHNPDAGPSLTDVARFGNPPDCRSDATRPDTPIQRNLAQTADALSETEGGLRGDSTRMGAGRTIRHVAGRTCGQGGYRVGCPQAGLCLTCRACSSAGAVRSLAVEQLLHDSGGEASNALEQIVSLWEFPRASIQSLPDESKALLRSSVILYTLVGDGGSPLSTSRRGRK